MGERNRAQFRRLPLRRRLERVVNLHVAFAVAILRHGFGHFGRQRGAFEQASVKLIGSDRTNHALGGHDLPATGKPNAPRAAVSIEQHAFHIRTNEDIAALIADQPLERRQRILGAALDDGRAGDFDRKGDDLGHLARVSAFRPEAGVQHPRREQRADDVRLETRLQPGARGAERFTEEIGEPAQSAAPRFPRHDLEHRARP